MEAQEQDDVQLDPGDVVAAMVRRESSGGLLPAPAPAPAPAAPHIGIEMEAPNAPPQHLPSGQARRTSVDDRLQAAAKAAEEAAAQHIGIEMEAPNAPPQHLPSGQARRTSVDDRLQAAAKAAEEAAAPRASSPPADKSVREVLALGVLSVKKTLSVKNKWLGIWQPNEAALVQLNNREFELRLCGEPLMFGKMRYRVINFSQVTRSLSMFCLHSQLLTWKCPHSRRSFSGEAPT